MNLTELSYNQALEEFQAGRVSSKEWQIYKSIWSWSAGRYGGRAGRVQEKYYDRNGSEKYWARIEAVKKRGIKLGLIKSEYCSRLY